MSSSNELIRFAKTFVTVLSILISIPFSHAADVQGPADKILGILNTVTESVDSQSVTRNSQDKVTIPMEVLEDNLAIKEIAAHIFGNPWQYLSATEKNNFIHYLKILLTHLVSEKTIEIKEGKGQLVQERIKGKRAVVKLKINLPQKSSSVVYNLIQSSSEWKIFDINVDGVSLLQNYIYQTRSIYNRSGYTGVMEEMKKKRQYK